MDFKLINYILSAYKKNTLCTIIHKKTEITL